MPQNKKDKKIMLFVDGPNIVREGYSLNSISNLLANEGTLFIKKIYLSKHVTEKLIEAVAIAGYEPIVCVTDDVDTKLAMDADYFIRANCNKHQCNIFALGSGDYDFFPVLALAKEEGLETLVFSIEEQKCSEALRNFADKYKVLKSEKN